LEKFDPNKISESECLKTLVSTASLSIQNQKITHYFRQKQKNFEFWTVFRQPKNACFEKNRLRSNLFDLKKSPK